MKNFRCWLFEVVDIVGSVIVIFLVLKMGIDCFMFVVVNVVLVLIVLRIVFRLRFFNCVSVIV